MTASAIKGLPWWPSGQDFVLLLQEAWVWSLVGELTSCMAQDAAKKKGTQDIEIKSINLEQSV